MFIEGWPFRRVGDEIRRQGGVAIGIEVRPVERNQNLGTRPDNKAHPRASERQTVTLLSSRSICLTECFGSTSRAHAAARPMTRMDTACITPSAPSDTDRSEKSQDSCRLT